MISYPVYKVVHLIGVFMALLALGGVLLQFGTGGGREHAWRKHVAITHGVGLLVALIGGFGMLARMGIAHSGLPGWIWAKLAIWTLLGAALGIVPRAPQYARLIWWVVLALGGTATWLAGNKPF